MKNKSYLVVAVVCVVVLVVMNTILLTKLRDLTYRNNEVQNDLQNIRLRLIEVQDILAEYREDNNLSSYASIGMIKTPFNRINEEQIKVYPDSVLINIAGVKWARFVSSGSMVPVLDDRSHALEIVPSSENDIYIGDIISYKYEKRTVVHRVVDIGEDEEGWYAITKGDGNEFPDPVRVRFENVERVVVGILY